MKILTENSVPEGWDNIDFKKAANEKLALLKELLKNSKNIVPNLSEAELCRNVASIWYITNLSKDADKAKKHILFQLDLDQNDQRINALIEYVIEFKEKIKVLSNKN